jgi:ligand-binding sensor domain-containing protein
MEEYDEYARSPVPRIVARMVDRAERMSCRIVVVLACMLIIVPSVTDVEAQKRSSKRARPGAGDPAQAATKARSFKRTIAMDTTIRFHRVGLSDGLPQSHVTAIVQDHVGFVWFGTQEGLARYDGAEFTVYRHQVGRPGPMPSSSVTALAVDGKGRLWIGTEKGLISYDVARDSFESLVSPANASSSETGRVASVAVTALFAEGGSVLVGYGDGTLALVDAATRKVTQAGKPAGAESNDPVTALARDRTGSAWVGIQGEGLYRLDPSGKLLARYGPEGDPNRRLAGATVNALLVTKRGTLWVGTAEAGLARLAAQDRFEHVAGGAGARQLTDPHVTFLVEDLGGALWIGTKNGLNRLDQDSLQVKRIEATQVWDPGNLSFPWLTAATMSRDGTIWIGTLANGVNRLDPLSARFRFITPNQAVASMFEDRNDVLWIGTFPGSLIRYDQRAAKAEIHPRMLTEDGQELDLAPAWITGLHVDRSGTVWMLTMGLGLLSFDPVTERVRVYSPQPGQRVTSEGFKFAAAEDGTLWLATWGSGLVKFNPRDQSFVDYTAGDGLSGIPTDYLYTVVIDRRDPKVLWLGTAKAGLVRFDSRTETSQVFRHVPGRPETISHDDVLSIYQGRDDLLWVGTYGGGLNRFDSRTGRFENFASEVGLTNSTIYGVSGDDSGVLWMATNGGGLVRFDPATRRMIAFDERDGVPNEYGQTSAYLAPSGRIYQAGPPGFAYWFRPKEIKLDTAPPPVVLTGLRVNNQAPALTVPSWSRPDLELRHDQNLLGFRIAGLAYASPQKIRYQYMIDGVTDGWVDAPASMVTTSLPSAGDYTLRARAASRHGQWGKPVALATLHLLPAPWKTWWAYTLYVSSALLVAFGFIRYQHKRVQRLHQAHRLAAVERDLELTGAVQSGCLPEDSLIVSQGVTVQGFYRPAGTCSGDWWWYETPRDGLHRLLVGDVTGHGPGPAMVTAAVASAYRMQTELASGTPLEVRLRAVNNEVLRVGQGTYHMSLTAIELDVTKRELHAYGAGGLPPVVMAGGGRAEVIVCRGTPLGASTFQVGTAVRRLQPGARIFLYTDGVIEIETGNGRQFGLRRLIRLLESTRDAGVEETASLLSREATTANGRAVQKDDWTFAIADWQRHI